MAKIKLDYNWDGTQNYDWLDAITRTGYYQDYNISFSGGNGKTRYYASLGYLNQEGVAINSDMKRYSARLNLETSYKWFNFGFNTSFALADMDAFSQSTGGSYSNPFVSATLKATPLDPFYNEDGSYNTSISYNPLAVYDKEAGDIYNTKTTTINLNPYFAINFGKGFILKTSLGINSYGTRQYDFWSWYNNQGASDNGRGTQYNSNTTTITWTNTLNWLYTFNEKHNVSVMLGQEAQWKNYWNEEYAGINFPLMGYRELNMAGSSYGIPSYKTRKARLASFFLNTSYDYQGKFYGQVSYRRDGSSVFGNNNRWGNFWSVGGKWRISEEEFLKDNDVFTNLAIRASYGTVDPLWYKNATGDETTTNWNECAKRYLGTVDPKAYGGFGTRLQWKNFDFSADFNYRLGGKVYASSNRFYLSVGSQGNIAPTTYLYENAWTEENRYTDVPKYVYGNTSGENNHSSRFLYSGNFLRVKNLQLGYTLPKHLLK